jgi:hypothetical protein
LAVRFSTSEPHPAGDEREPAGRRAWQRTPRSKR